MLVKLFGKGGLIVSVGSAAVAITAVLVAWSALKAKAQEEFVTPVVKKQVEIASAECKKQTDELRSDMVTYQEEQGKTNDKILEILHRIDKSSAEMQRDVEWLKRNK